MRVRVLRECWAVAVVFVGRSDGRGRQDQPCKLSARCDTCGKCGSGTVRFTVGFQLRTGQDLLRGSLPVL